MSIDPVETARLVSSANELEAAVLARLQTDVGFDVAFFAYAGATPTVVGLSAERIARAVEPGNPYEAELWPVKQAALSARGVALDTEVLGAQRVHRTAYFRDFAKAVGGRQTMLAVLALRGQILGGLMLGRTGSNFRSSDVAVVESLLPALSVARASFGLPGFSSRPLRRPTGLASLRRSLAVAALPAADIIVRDRSGFREMVARDRDTRTELIWTRSGIADPSRSGWPYIDLFHLAAALARRRERALFVGCGGAVAPRQFAQVYPGIQLDVVEREEIVARLACDWFDAAGIPGARLHIDDGARFVAGAKAASWDVAVIDAFDARALASGLSCPAFFADLARAVRPGGAFAFNLVAKLDGTGPLSQVLDAARCHFADSRVLPVVGPRERALSASELRNVVVVGVKSR
jgi:hypothetical protein